MVLYEFSIFYEKVTIFFQLMVGVVFIAGFAFLGLKVLRGVYSYVVLVPIIFAVAINYGLYGKLNIIYQLQYKLENNMLDVISGRLQSIVHEKRTDVFLNNSSSTMVEELLIGSNKLTRVSPKIYSGGRGCLRRNLKEDLQAYIGEKVRVSYVKYENSDMRFFLPCILKVETKPNETNPGQPQFIK